jgi:hypothetical protein
MKDQRRTIISREMTKGTTAERTAEIKTEGNGDCIYFFAIVSHSL